MPPEEDVFSISENVMLAMLQFETLHACAIKEADDHLVTAFVQICGKWNGAVLLRTSQNFATKAAANLLALQTELVQNADREDALAELANMIGGQIKSMLPGPSYLSLPGVALEAGKNFRLLGTSVACAVPMVIADESFHVVIVQATEPQVASEQFDIASMI